jgi:hypothetical protein
MRTRHPNRVEHRQDVIVITTLIIMKNNESSGHLLFLFLLSCLSFLVFLFLERVLLDFLTFQNENSSNPGINRPQEEGKDKQDTIPPD